MDNKLKPYLIMGAGLFIGLGTGFFLLPNGVAFMGRNHCGHGGWTFRRCFFQIISPIALKGQSGLFHRQLLVHHFGQIDRPNLPARAELFPCGLKEP